MVYFVHSQHFRAWLAHEEEVMYAHDDTISAF